MAKILLILTTIFILTSCSTRTPFYSYQTAEGTVSYKLINDTIIEILFTQHESPYDSAYGVARIRGNDFLWERIQLKDKILYQNYFDERITIKAGSVFEGEKEIDIDRLFIFMDMEVRKAYLKKIPL
jgi:hypothetical protein